MRTLRHGDAIPTEKPKRYKNQQGYVRLRWLIDGEYTEAYEHRVVMGLPEDDMHVHHLDGNKANNRRSNLVVLTAEEHGRLHAAQEAAGRDPERYGGHRSRQAQEKAQRAARRRRERMERDQAMAKRYRDGANTLEIAQEFGLSPGVVSRRLRGAGVLMRPPRGRTPKDPMKAARPLVHARSGMRCEFCGADTKWAGSHLHHRQLRRHGDHSAANLIHLCAECHGEVHDGPARARGVGLIVLSGAAPEAVPAWSEWRRGWFLLARDGTMEQVTEREALRRLTESGHRL